MNKSSVIIFVIIIFVAQRSDASFLSKIRKMADVNPQVNETHQIIPSPAPIAEKELNQNGINNNNMTLPEESHGKDKNIKDGNEEEVTNEKCEASSISRCRVEGKMTACVKRYETGSQDLMILIQNDGETVLNVSVIVPASVEVSTKLVVIPQHQAKKINASTTVGKAQKITLNTNPGGCVLNTGVIVSEGNFFQRIPSYANLVTPTYGAYFIILVALVVGGTWGCCMLRKKRRRGTGEVPYQELEMALPESASAVNVDAAEGWDEGWDEDWDQERAVKSPGHVGNLSANGLTSRSTNRDGWENDWDD
ncbi:hypothetical protein IFM89_003508 [Coptis chinensis]|uniref:DUF7356 domain-containing protein n=1 Tax=Coptis chinensis TaxID=261450 RepID=A0A835LQF3_9MAGN|nr:hypothetical protein IFM89_003508 [Coptis chinensis]